MAIWKPELGRLGARLRGGLGRRGRDDELAAVLVRELVALQREIRHANLIQYHRLVVEQASQAMDDPELAATLSTLPDVTDRKRRQLLFANREYATVLLAHRVGMFDWEELIGHLRILCRNTVFADYWQRTTEHRRSLPPHTLEGRAGHAVDVLMEELADEPDEWWVVGQEVESADSAAAVDGVDGVDTMPDQRLR
ncbi:hypothetical protein GTY65_29590 [Streptomyces sp. SID8379]|uniref:DUF6082 family protein n=1 Tax=unclassified Streptomyces TaxID=2593676 RepID=UPI000369E011|nr:MULTISPECIES: DUF6082 family protein [unclassified Streptomyces]MYW68198.1 hypothetical protein [Streptomyces sp. SID8379]